MSFYIIRRMTLIYESSNKKTRISKTGENRYQISFPYQSNTKIFWTNFPWKKLKRIESSDEGITRNYVFKAQSVQTLAQFLAREGKHLSYEQTLTFFTQIGNYIKSLERFNIGILSLELSDFIVVNDTDFFLVEDTKSVKIWNKEIEIKDPSVLKKYQKNKFVAPEIKKINSFPTRILALSAYYNVAAITIFCLLNKYLANESPIIQEKELGPIYQTKLYWGLQRCLQKDPEKRFFLII